jgi:protoporphyrinogen oxidase
MTEEKTPNQDETVDETETHIEADRVAVTIEPDGTVEMTGDDRPETTDSDAAADQEDPA